MQRRGIKPVLLCHKIDLDKISYLDVVRLRDFMSADGEILSKKDTGLCSKCQRVVSYFFSYMLSVTRHFLCL